MKVPKDLFQRCPGALEMNKIIGEFGELVENDVRRVDSEVITGVIDLFNIAF